LDRIIQFVDPSSAWQHRGLMAEGLGVTVALSLLAFALAIVPAGAVALARCYGPRWLAPWLAGFVNLVRSVPTVLAVVFIYLALPFVGLTFEKFTSVLLALVPMQIAYLSEVFRAALMAVGRGQRDAASALGLTPVQSLRLVIAPQAARVAAPPFASSLVVLVQNTSIASAIALNDLITAALAVQSLTAQPSALFYAALGYLAVILPMVRLARRWERGLARWA
jgi:polar amino acid transport system permease protein